MKKIYSIWDERQKEWICEPIALDTDLQASRAYAQMQKEIHKQGLKITDLRLYYIGNFDYTLLGCPMTTTTEPIEIPVEIITTEEE